MRTAQVVGTVGRAAFLLSRFLFFVIFLVVFSLSFTQANPERKCYHAPTLIQPVSKPPTDLGDNEGSKANNNRVPN
jgi:hypothetical protein